MVKTEPFGQIAVRMGFCTQEDIDLALEAQKQLKADEKEHKLIGMILLEMRALSTTQLIQILQYYDHSAAVPTLEEEPPAPQA
ncbi:MAG: hypothetical protein J7M19_08585 [Planctomycetes bacterium]|nr:hypothetical protein [Planctomycetota bacterium]